jgi:hypothetical protein
MKIKKLREVPKLKQFDKQLRLLHSNLFNQFYNQLGYKVYDRLLIKIQRHLVEHIWRQIGHNVKYSIYDETRGQ